jgi:PAS domain S-box-containing protein
MRHRRTAARVKEVRAHISSLPQPDPRAVPSDRARDAFFAAFSRELRWSLDDEGRFLLLEGAWELVLGWQPEHLHGWYWEELVHPADRDRVREVLSRVRRDRDCERDVEVRLAVQAGGHRLTSWTFVAGAGPDSILGLGHDRTDPPDTASQANSPIVLERRNAQLAARVRELEERYEAVERFAGTAAHQLAEPLIIAESSAILVAEELGADLDPILRGRLDAIGRGAARARRLMDALLADARTDGRPLELRTVDVADVVEETLESLDHQIEARSASIVVGPLPEVQGEPELLSVVLENLVSNALKYGPRTDGRMVIASEPCSDGWRISVVSEGMPIPKEEADRIFQPFHRVPGERRVPGVGLGLTICERLMERLGGAIGVEPGADSGNAFWIRLPAAGEASA